MKINISSKISSIILAAAILLGGAAAGLACITTPRPYTGNDDSIFSASKASLWIKEISRKPHSVFDMEAHKEVQEYLVNELEKLGLEVSLKEYTLRSTDPDQAGPKELQIYNIHAKLDGKSDDAILLVSHYDSGYNWDPVTGPSGGESFGAADDGYGVASILETIRVIKSQNKPLENDLQILITDAEELGLLGAEKEMTLNPGAFKNVKLVINLEARGIKGPAIMFETGENNSAVMDYYIKNARMPLSYSFATDIYRLMPNGTDFSCFIERGFTGYNLAVLDNLDYYHTSEDNFSNIDLSSLQHYGEQISPIVHKFVFTPSDKLPAFKSESSSTFFNIFPGVLLQFSQITGMILLGIALVLFIVLMILGKRNLWIRPGGVLKITGIMLAILTLFTLFGTLVAYLASIAFKMQFDLVYLVKIPYSNLILAGVILLGAVTLIMAVRRAGRKSKGGLEPLMAGILLNILLAILAQVFLPGMAYVFAIPALFAASYVMVAIAVKSRILQVIVLALVSVTMLVFYIPLIYMFNLAMTFGACGVTTVFALICFSMLIPLYNHYIFKQA